MIPSGAAPWFADWLWSLPLIVVTVVIHVYGLALIGERVVAVLSESADRKFMLSFIRGMGVTALLATTLHGIEGAIWAWHYTPIYSSWLSQVENWSVGTDRCSTYPGFPLSKWANDVLETCKAIDRRGFGRDQGGAEVERRWVRRKNSPFSSRSIAR
jgi:hypothetical protein